MSKALAMIRLIGSARRGVAVMRVEDPPAKARKPGDHAKRAGSRLHFLGSSPRHPSLYAHIDDKRARQCEMTRNDHLPPRW